MFSDVAPAVSIAARNVFAPTPKHWNPPAAIWVLDAEADVPDPSEGSGDSASDQLIDRHELRSAPADIGGKDFRLSLSDGPHCGCAAG